MREATIKVHSSRPYCNGVVEEKVRVGDSEEKVKDMWYASSIFYANRIIDRWLTIYHFSDHPCKRGEAFRKSKCVCILTVNREVTEIHRHIPGRCSHRKEFHYEIR